MNYLGHSMFPLEDKERNDKIIFGNVCGDFFKGPVEKLELEEDIRKGILLHRALDSATDSNEYFLKNKRLLKKYKLYSGVILDIFNDHFLAKNFDNFSNTSLKRHNQSVYSILDANQHLLNEKGQKTFYWMNRGDWLTNYTNIDFVEDVLYGISSRFKRENNLYESVDELKLDYSEFESNFFLFWESLTKQFK